MERKRLLKVLLNDVEQSADVSCEDQQAIVCLVGEDIHGKRGIAARVFNTVAEAAVNIRMISQGGSEINISFVVKESDVPTGVRHLHEHFFPAARGSKNAAHKRNGIGRRVATNGSGATTSRRSPSHEITAVELRASRP